jgi:hypothetical protein
VQGKEKGYFGYYGPDGTLEESFEGLLADYEGECNDLVACAKFDTFHWPHGAREKIASYAALLYSRATQRRASSARQSTKILAELREAATDAQLIKEIADAIGHQLKPKGVTKTRRSSE